MSNLGANRLLKFNGFTVEFSPITSSLGSSLAAMLYYPDEVTGALVPLCDPIQLSTTNPRTINVSLPRLLARWHAAGATTNALRVTIYEPYGTLPGSSVSVAVVIRSRAMLYPDQPSAV